MERDQGWEFKNPMRVFLYADADDFLVATLDPPGVAPKDFEYRAHKDVPIPPKFRLQIDADGSQTLMRQDPDWDPQESDRVTYLEAFLLVYGKPPKVYASWGDGDDKSVPLSGLPPGSYREGP